VDVGDVSGVTVHPVLAIDEMTKRICMQAAGSGSGGGFVASPQPSAVTWEAAQTLNSDINATLVAGAEDATYVMHTTADGAFDTRAAIPSADVEGLTAALADLAEIAAQLAANTTEIETNTAGSTRTPPGSRARWTRAAKERTPHRLPTVM
jgi:hypothetical protein